MTTSIPEFGSVDEAAAHFRCSRKAVYSGVKLGTIPHIRLGRTIRIPIRAITENANAEAATCSTPGLQSEGAIETLPAEGVSP